MTVYGGVLTFFLGLSGQLTPAELLVLNLPSHACLFLVHNLASLLLIGGGTCYTLGRDLVDTVLVQSRIAVVIITSMFHIVAALTYLFLSAHHILYRGSYDGIRRYLQPYPDFLRPPLADGKFKVALAIVFITIVTWRTTIALRLLYSSEPKDSLYLFGTVSSFLSHAYSLLYALKLTLIGRRVKLHFLRANSLLSTSIKHLNHSKSCPVSKGEFDKLVKYWWDSQDFLAKVNDMTGLQYFVLMSYLYLGILYRLYNATLYSALFSVDEPDVEKAWSNLGQAILNVMISFVLLGNGSSVTREVEKTTEMIWNAVPKIKCTECRKKFDIFASHASHLPADVTAKGIFTLNMKTFSNMISSLATQFVILISLGNQ